jgi:hypothetical protein
LLVLRISEEKQSSAGATFSGIVDIGFCKVCYAEKQGFDKDTPIPFLRTLRGGIFTMMNREKPVSTRAVTVDRDEVSTSTWIPFFNDFISTYRGRAIVLEEFAGDEPAGRRILERLPLQSVATVLGTPGANTKVDVRGANSMAIGVSDRTGKLITHNIEDVVRVYEWKDSERKTNGLEIETRQGTRVEMRFV